MRYFYVTFFSLFVFISSANAQSYLKDSVLNAFLIQVNYTVQQPLADLADRFGVHSNLGGGIAGKFGNNFILGLESDYVFGKKVKETDMLDDITDEYGSLIGTDGLLTGPGIAQKGFAIKAYLGKIIPFNKPNINSGLYFNIGIGYYQHKINFDVKEDLVPQLNSTYQKGYDRLTGGPVLSQFLGYMHLHTKKRINFYGGVVFNEAFTKSKRSFNFDEKREDNASRLDATIGFRVGWIIPIYFESTEKYYYY